MEENWRISSKQKDLLEQHLKAAIRNFVEGLYAFDEAAFNRIADVNSWSAAQIGSHINKSMQFIHQVVTDKTSQAQRNPAAHIEVLKAMMENMHTKGKSAAQLLPSPDFLTRTSMRNEVTDATQLLAGDIQTLELSSICDAMNFPTVGFLSRYELISFAVFHIERHTRQLAATYAAMQAKNTYMEG